MPARVAPERALVPALAHRGCTMVTAESLTAGLIDARIAAVPGASKILWGGIISYQNEAKERLLGVDSQILSKFGSVSRETVEAMARGALVVSGCDVSVAVSGIAGPSGGTPENPVGTVWVSVGKRTEQDGISIAESVRLSLSGNRNSIRSSTVTQALLLVLDCLDRHWGEAVY
ncbi:MAG TPA: CinA family protein [Treponemataceae bacterium]|nr:CinA family protein [Treponemataceae bacterium]